MLAIEEVSNELESLKYMEDGNLLLLVPRLIEQMTQPDRVAILEWHIQEGDLVQPDAPMLLFDFLGDDYYLPVPPVSTAMRVARIIAAVGDIVHLDDPLIVLEPIP